VQLFNISRKVECPSAESEDAREIAREVLHLVSRYLMGSCDIGDIEQLAGRGNEEELVDDSFHRLEVC
jgi:hypothetical protein